MIFIDACSRYIQFSRISSRSTIGLKKYKKSVLQSQIWETLRLAKFESKILDESFPRKYNINIIFSSKIISGVQQEEIFQKINLLNKESWWAENITLNKNNKKLNKLEIKISIMHISVWVRQDLIFQISK